MIETRNVAQLALYDISKLRLRTIDEPNSDIPDFNARVFHGSLRFGWAASAGSTSTTAHVNTATILRIVDRLRTRADVMPNAGKPNVISDWLSRIHHGEVFGAGFDL
jgi:hypothetical protein